MLHQSGTSVLLWATALAALPMSVYPEEMKPEGVDTHTLEEFRWLSELQDGLAAAIGGKKGGRGLSARSALLAYEQGGSDYREHRYRASTYVMDQSRWSQTREWTLLGYPVTLGQLIRDIGRLSDRMQTIFRRPPVRRDGPLREANLSDEDVREIQAAARGIVPVGTTTRGQRSLQSNKSFMTGSRPALAKRRQLRQPHPHRAAQ